MTVNPYRSASSSAPLRAYTLTSAPSVAQWGAWECEIPPAPMIPTLSFGTGYLFLSNTSRTKVDGVAVIRAIAAILGTRIVWLRFIATPYQSDAIVGIGFVNLPRKAARR